MNSHIQLNEDGSFFRYIPAGIPVEWDSDNYCTAFALEQDGKSEEFRVYQLYSTNKPEFNDLTHELKQVNAVCINDLWTEQWEVVALTGEDALTKLQQWRNSVKCTRRQGELALIEVGKIEMVESAIASIADLKERRKAQAEYSSDTWERSNQFLQTMWQALGGTEEELDNLFRLAGTL